MDFRIKELLFFTGRVILYSGVMVLLNAVFTYDARNPTSTGKFGEISGTEILQEILLFLSGIIFLVTGRKNRDLAPVTNLLSLLFFMAFVREFNNQIDYWFYLVVPMILLLCWLVVRDRKKLIASLHEFIREPRIAWFVTGFLVTFVFSRFFGRSLFWQELLEGDYNRWAKNAAEEGVELLGYTFFVISGIEMLIAVPKKSKRGAR